MIALLRSRAKLEETLREFAIRVNREVNIRLGHFDPATPQEHRQRSEGVVSVHKLDAVMDFIPGGD